MSRWVSVAVGVLLGALLALGWWSLAGRQAEPCRALDSALLLEGAEVSAEGDLMLPVGTQFVVVGSDEIHEVRLPVEIPPDTPIHACIGERPAGLFGEAR